ncbi:MAG: hypothetical protein WCW36_02820 [Candidatus Paceibacterota bacterium]|jgi:hypothetical protein
MKSKTTLYISFGIVALAALVIAGCNNYSSSSSSSTTSTAQEPPGLPPDPGPAGKTTLAGIDSNGNIARDDVERYIAINHQDSAKVRAALMQFAVVAQLQLIDSADKQKSIQHANESGAAIDCLVDIAGSVQKAENLYDNLQSVILNTDARNKAYFTYDNQLGGQYFPDSTSTCTFDPSTLPN